MKKPPESEHSSSFGIRHSTFGVPGSNVITGVGLVTPLGVGLDVTWRAIRDGAFVVDVGRVDVARVPRVSRVAQLALIAAREAIQYRDITDAALVIGTSKGPADEWLRDLTTARGLSTLGDEIAGELQIGGSPRFTLSAACASGLHAVARATMLLDRGEIKRVIVVASESSLHPIWRGTFKRLGVLAPPGEPGRPFDIERRGFVISEAAAAIVIDRRAAQPGDLVIRSAMIASDPTHLTGCDPHGGPSRALIGRVVGADAGKVEFVHAHATGTAVDAIELATIRSLLPDVPVYSHKGAIGHTLGASGVVALALSARSHAAGYVLPMSTTQSPLINLAAGGQSRRIRESLILASGFGGALAAVRLGTEP